MRCCTNLYAPFNHLADPIPACESLGAVHSSALIDGWLGTALAVVDPSRRMSASYWRGSITGTRASSRIARATGSAWPAPTEASCQFWPLQSASSYPASTRMSGQSGESRVRFLIRYAASNGLLTDVRAAKRRSIVVPSLSTPPAAFLRPECSPTAIPLSIFCRQTTPRRASNLRLGRATAHTIRANLFASATTTTLRFARSSSARAAS